MFAIPGVLPTTKVTPGATALTLAQTGGASITVDSTIALGAPTASDYVALASKVATNLDAIKSLLSSGLTVSGTSACPAGAGTISGLATGAYTPTSTAATKVKAV